MPVDSADRVLDLVDRVQPRLRRGFVDAIADIRSEKTLDLLEELLTEGRISEALLVGEIAALKVVDPWVAAFFLAGERAADAIGEALGVVGTFDRISDRAAAVLQRERLRLVQSLTRGQRDMLREVLARGIERGLNPRDQARLLRDSIGLTASQARTVDNYRRLLQAGSRDALDRALRDRRFDRTVQRAIDGEPLSAAQIERMVDRYRERLIKFRAETIARTEALAAVNEGTSEMFRQAVDRGIIDGDTLVEEWRTAQDERVRSSHATMHRQRQPIGQAFLSGRGNRLRFPGDPLAPAADRVNCRCAIARTFEAPEA